MYFKFGDVLGEVQRRYLWQGVVPPLNSLMNDQIACLRESSGIQASVIDVKELTRDENDDVFNVDIDFRL